MSNDDDQIPADDFDKPVPKGGGELPPLPFLPDREWLEAYISKVEYRYAKRKGVFVYVQDAEKQDVLDEAGQPIKKREFNIKFNLEDYDIPNAKVHTPRSVWLALTASLNDKANLPKFLKNVGMDLDKDDLSPNAIIKHLGNIEVQLQLKNNESKSNGKMYQQVVFDAVRLPKSLAPVVKKAEKEEEVLY